MTTQNSDSHSQPPPEGHTLSALARIIGCDRKTVQKALLGVTPCGRDHNANLYRLVDVQNALAQKPDKKLKDQKLEQEIIKLELANKERAGRLVDVEKLAADSAPLFLKIKEKLYQKIVNELPSDLSGVDVATGRLLAQRRADELLHDWQEIFRSWGLKS